MTRRRRSSPLLAALLTTLCLAPLILPGAGSAWHRDWPYFEHQARVARQAVLAGTPPDLNPWHCAGTDLASNAQDLSPSPLFAAVLALGPGWGLRLAALLWLVAGAASMAWLLTLEGQRRLAAVAGGLLWAALPYLAVHLSEGHLPFAGLAFMPLALGTSLKASRAATKNGARSLSLALGAVLAAQLLWGGPYAAAFTGLALLADAGARALTTRSPTPLRPLPLAALFAGLLALPKLLPVLDLLSRFPRTPIWRDALTPALLGRALFSREVASIPVPGQPWQWPEYALYPGVSILLLAALGLLWRRRPPRPPAVSAGLLTILGAWLMLGAVPGGLWQLLEHLPIIGHLRVPSRYAILMLLGLVILAARALDRLAAHPRLSLLAPALALLALLELGSLSAAWWRHAPTGAPLHAGPAPPPLRAGPAARAPEEMPLAPEARQVIANCYEPGPHTIPLPLQGESSIPFLQGEARITAFAPGRLTLEAAPGARLTLAQAHTENWSAQGARLSPAPGGLLAVELRSARATLRYQNPLREEGLAIALLTALGALLWSRRSRRRRPARTGRIAGLAAGTCKLARARSCSSNH